MPFFAIAAFVLLVLLFVLPSVPPLRDKVLWKHHSVAMVIIAAVLFAAVVTFNELGW